MRLIGRRGGRVQALICWSAVALYPRVASLDKRFDARLSLHPGESFWMPLGVAKQNVGGNPRGIPQYNISSGGRGSLTRNYFTLRESKISSLGRASKWGRPAPFAMSYMVGREDKRKNNRAMLPAPKIDAAAGYQGPMKKELLKGAGLLSKCSLINKILTRHVVLVRSTFSSSKSLQFTKLHSAAVRKNNAFVKLTVDSKSSFKSKKTSVDLFLRSDWNSLFVMVRVPLNVLQAGERTESLKISIVKIQSLGIRADGI